MKINKYGRDLHKHLRLKRLRFTEQLRRKERYTTRTPQQVLHILQDCYQSPYDQAMSRQGILSSRHVWTIWETGVHVDIVILQLEIYIPVNPISLTASNRCH